MINLTKALKEDGVIGIIAAMEPELASLREKIDSPVVESINGVDYICGRLCGHRVVLARCGVGKVFAASCASIMIYKYGVCAIINTGVAGTLDPDLSILDFAISVGVVQHDMDTSHIGDPVGLISGINMITLPAHMPLCNLVSDICDDLGFSCKQGIIASGDQFIANADKKRYIRTTFDAIACEMESAAIGQVCYISSVPFLAIRCISDSASGDGTMEYPTFLPLAAERSLSVVEELLRILPVPDSQNALRRIASFDVDHDYITPGVYVSRIDGDVTTYDLRTRRPNCGDYMSDLTIHSLEHMFATYIRNRDKDGRIIYFGPMGCRTGFYLLVRNAQNDAVLEEIKAVLALIANEADKMFGDSPKECGNYRELSLSAAKEEAARYLAALESAPHLFDYPKAPEAQA